MTYQKNFPQKIKWHAPDQKQVLPRIVIAARHHKFTCRILGTLPSGDDILLFQSPAPPGSPSVLIAAGFHGEEIGGPLGILNFFETSNNIWNNVNLSIIPILNPTGYRLGQRRNQWGENPNDGFCHPDIDPNQPSKEGRILLNNLTLLKKCSKNAFLSLHEDGFPTGHIYTYGTHNVAKILLNEMSPFGITPDHTIFENNIKLNGGLFINRHDGSFEDRLHHEGSLICICSETPRMANLDLRAEVNAKLICALLLYVKKTTKY